MMNGKWKGTALFLAILVVMCATFGLRLFSSSTHSALTTSLTRSPGTPASAPKTMGKKATTGSTTSPATTTITGDPENTPYGNVQVAVAFKGKTITGVTVLQIPNSGNYDQRVAQAVPPSLLQEILASQSTAVNTVSGGTYTSTGYLQSAQSAIDKLP
jgi:uncharacterized protein with FMN-binding domain